MTTTRGVFYALVPGADAETLLLCDTPAGLMLPNVELDADPASNAALVTDAFAARYGLRLTRRQSIARWENAQNGMTTSVTLWATERHDTAPTPDLVAVPLTDAPRRIADRRLSAALDRWLDTALHPQAEPWAHPGWFAEAVRWLDSVLRAHRLERIGDVRQLKVWPLSCVLEAQTSGGRVFLKAIPPIFEREPGVTAELAERFPAHIPPVLAVDRERGWTLLRDHRAQALRDIDDVDLWAATLKRYGQIQVGLSRQLDSLFAAGCIDRRLDTLPGNTAALLAACRSLLPEPNDLETVAAVENAIPVLHNAIRSLDALGIAQTLVHGDFHPNNVAVSGTRPIYFDWTDASVACPFIDLLVFLEEAKWESALFAQTPDADSSLIDAYLSAYRAAYDANTLAQALTLARPVAALHMVTSYVWITEALAPEDRSEMQGALAFWLKRLVATLNPVEA